MDRKTKVYFAEHDVNARRPLANAMRANGFDVRCFESGYPLVEMMDDWPDLFIIDIELPGINGIEVCKWLKRHEASSNIPVIFVANDSYLRVLASSAPADDYIQMPVDADEFLRRITDTLISAYSAG